MVAADGDSPEKIQGKSYQNARVAYSSTIQTCRATLMETGVLVLA